MPSFQIGKFCVVVVLTTAGMLLGNVSARPHEETQRAKRGVPIREAEHYRGLEPDLPSPFQFPRPRDPAPVERIPLPQLSGSLGNREAELVGNGMAPPASRPVSRPSSGSPGGSDSELASALATLNREADRLAKKIDALERNVEQQARPQGIPGPQGRPAPGESTGELADKIADLEQLVLVALRGQTGAPKPGVMGRPGPPGQPVSDRGLPGISQAVERMNEDEMEATSRVLERAQNRGVQRKSLFSVASSRSATGVNGRPGVIAFDHTFTNKGGDFSMSRNKFICQHTGFYYFTFTVRSSDGKYLGVALMKNQQLQSAIYTDRSDRNIMQSQSVLLHLRPRDEVYLRHAPSTSFSIDSNSHRYVTFSGFLVQKGN